MKNFKEFISEASTPAEGMMKDIEKSFKKQFPKGWSIIHQGGGISKDTISIVIGLIGNKSDLPNGILENDPMFHSWLLFQHPKGYTAEILQAGISINPPEDSYLAMGRIKTKWRKTTGDEAKMVKTLDAFFKKLKKLVKDNEDNIFGRSKYNDKYFK